MLVNMDNINKLRGYSHAQNTDMEDHQEQYGYQPENYPGTDDVTGMFKAILDKVNYILKCMAEMKGY